MEEWGQDILAPFLFSWEQVDGFEAGPGFSISPGLEPKCWTSRNGISLALGDGVQMANRKKASPEEPALLLSWGNLA